MNAPIADSLVPAGGIDRERVLAGDIGGTSTRLAIFERNGPKPRVVVEKVYSSKAHATLDEIVAAFVVEHPIPIAAAAFGIAGPVLNGRVQTPNLAWTVGSSSLARLLALPSVALINDLEANAWGIGALEAKDLLVLNAGNPDATGNRAILSPGTGLGEAGLYWDGKTHRPFACEGGHADFAPRNDHEIALLKHLLAKHERVSYERVLSGPGLAAIFEFLQSTSSTPLPSWFVDECKAGDVAAAVSRAALGKRLAVAVHALDLFVGFYGAEAGNLGLKMMATGGVFIGGGIAPRIVEKFQTPLFMEAFTAKGRMRELMRAMPVHVILNDKTALLGAARYAIAHAGQSR
ncbi:MAG: glucokinase [Burkholderiales bacterium]